MKLKLYFLMVTLSMTLTTFSQTLDQSQTVLGSQLIGVVPGQSFVAGINGSLSKFSYYYYYINNAYDFQLQIYSGSGNTGTLLGTQSFSTTSATPNGEFEVPITTPIELVAGNTYTIYVSNPNNTLVSAGIGVNNEYSSGGYFDENSDYSQLGYDLWFKIFVTQRPSTHLDFDGINDRVELPNESNFDFTSTFSMEAWIRVTSFTQEWQTVISKGAEGPRIHRFGGSNFIAFGTGPANDLVSTVSVNDGNWHHIAAICNNGFKSLYVDGVLQGTQTVGTPLVTNNDNVRIGSQIDSYSPIRAFHGDIDEVRFWNVARTAEQINGSRNCELQGTETGLVAYYNFNQGIDAADNTGITSLIDATTNANNGTLVNFTKTGAVSNFLAGSPVTTGSIIPSVATVTTPVVYGQGDTASALTATTGTNGTGLVWYTAATGGTGATTAPTPSTATVGSTSYWVSSTNANGCESTRTEIVVNVLTPATHLNFDGVNDFVDLGTSNLLKPTTAITVELNAFMSDWSSAAGFETIIGNAQNGGWFIGIEGTDLVAGVRRNGGYGKALFPLSSLSSGWHHIAMDYASGYVHMFIDGVYVSENNAGGTFPISYAVANSTIIGSEASDTPGIADLSRCFNGNIDDVRIWNSVRTPSQIANSKDCELLGTETGLIAYYKFNHGNSGVDNTNVTSLTDATANANDGTLTNFALTGSTSNWLAGSPIDILPSVATVTTPVTYNQGATATALTATTGTNGSGLLWYTTATGGTGATTAPTPSTATIGSTSYWVTSTNANGCESARTEIVVNVLSPATHLNFDGVNDRINCGNNSSVQITGSNITLEAMIRLNSFASFPNDGNIINKEQNSPDNGYMLRVGGSGIVDFTIGNGSWNSINSPVNSLQLATWHHVVGTYDGVTMKIYVDGVMVTSQPSTLSIGNSTSDLFIGDWPNGGRNLDGDIDEVRVWNRALTIAEIQNNMNCELPSPSTQNGLVAYYQFNQGSNASDNTSITTLTDASVNTNNGTLSGFTKTGTTSNFLAGSPIVTGTNCTALSTSNFEIANNIKMYPNPTNNIVTVEVNNLTNAKLQVLDITGKILMNQALNANSNNVDVQHLPSGMYLFKVSSNEGISTGKIIKN